MCGDGKDTIPDRPPLSPGDIIIITKEKTEKLNSEFINGRITEMNTVIRSSNIIENFNGLNMRLLNSLYSDPNSDPNIPLNTFKETYKSLISSYSKEVEKKTIEMDKVIKGENFKNGFEKLDIMTLSSIYTISEHIILNSELEEFKKVYGKLLYFNNVLQDGIHSIDIEAVFNSLSIEELQKLYLQISPESKYQRVTFLQEILNKKGYHIGKDKGGKVVIMDGKNNTIPSNEIKGEHLQEDLEAISECQDNAEKIERDGVEVKGEGGKQVTLKPDSPEVTNVRDKLMEALKDPKRLASNEFIGEVLSTPYALPAIGILIIVGIFKGGKHRTAALWTLFSFIGLPAAEALGKKFGYDIYKGGDNKSGKSATPATPEDTPIPTENNSQNNSPETQNEDKIGNTLIKKFSNIPNTIVTGNTEEDKKERKNVTNILESLLKNKEFRKQKASFLELNKSDTNNEKLISRLKTIGVIKEGEQLGLETLGIYKSIFDLLLKNSEGAVVIPYKAETVEKYLLGDLRREVEKINGIITKFSVIKDTNNEEIGGRLESYVEKIKEGTSGYTTDDFNEIIYPNILYMFLVSRKPELFVEEQKKYENQINASSEFMRRDDYMITEDIKYRVFNKNEHGGMLNKKLTQLKASPNTNTNP